MTALTRMWPIWMLWGIAVLLDTATLVLQAWNRSQVNWSSRWSGEPWVSEDLFVVLLVVGSLTYATVGTVVAMRRPGHRMGWLCLALGLVLGLHQATEQYAVMANALVRQSAAHLAGLYAGLLSNAVLPVVVLLVTLLLLLFPTGHLPSRRWRWVAWGLILNTGLLVVTALGDPEPYANGFLLINPLDPAVRRALDLTRVVGDRLGVLTFLALLLGLVLGGLAVGRRWRQARGPERQQLKWLALVGSVIASAAVGVLVAMILTGSLWDPLALPFVLIGVVGFTVGIPVVIGLAILRYHLFDVDILIRLTVLYGALTTVLALVYVVSVALLQTLFRAVSGQDHEIAIILSTLAIAVVFQPVRARLHGGIDRRFYRQRYDAVLTLERYGARLRDEQDLSTLTDGLVAAVQEAVQPTSISLWIGPSPSGRRDADG